MNQKAVTLKSIRKKYPLVKPSHKGRDFHDFWALKDIDLEIERGQTIGIIGRNGAGKSTLLYIIAGVLSPSKGDILVNGRAMGLFNLGVGFQDELSGRENIFLNATILGAARGEIENKLDSIIKFSELGEFINMPLGSYSQGMRLRLGFSIIANLDFDILVVDEVLAVGDTLFQNKCFERLIDFKRQGKTLIITTQGMGLIERLCDRVMLLDHGQTLFTGGPAEAIKKYNSLLNSERFFVGPNQDVNLVKNTKRWADNVSDWGQKFGGKEVIVESVEFISRNRAAQGRVNTLESLAIRVYYTARERVKDLHFGIAIFRKDGVYCYGPNTEFDGYEISELKKGKGHFALFYHSIFLAPGTYRVSVAIWDKKEVLPFDHHYGCYELIVTGRNDQGCGLLNIPFKIENFNIGQNLASFFTRRKNGLSVNFDLLKDRFGHRDEHEDVKIDAVNFLDAQGDRKDIFITNESIRFQICFNRQRLINKRGRYLWFGIYRDDGIYCQGTTMPFGDQRIFQILFPKLALLPGQYSVSIGVWDSLEKRFLMHHHGVYPFQMVFDKQDHGTVYLEHEWILKED
ncbi:MAG: ABC transporter ATP-binding protein [Candidatus Gorgyraea atricola]|nr:ABC transporter ATP-binding protein [Candidatus Gorgyraea atricola]